MLEAAPGREKCTQSKAFWNPESFHGVFPFSILNIFNVEWPPAAEELSLF